MTDGPWIDGASVLKEIRASVTRYVALPSSHAEVSVTLWIAATHAVDALHTAARLALRSPEKRCGKSRLLDLVGALSRDAIPTANVSSAALYRLMGGNRKPTLIIDEADTIWGSRKTAEQNEDLRGLVNAGFERGRPALRYDAASRKVEELETFGFVALAGIGALPDTITDRAVNITMRRRRTGEKVSPFRSRRDGRPLRKMRDQLAGWVAAHVADIEKATPDLPVEDRAADVWEALIIIADVAGGEWPHLARAAALALTAEQEEDDRDSSSLTLLTDIRETFRTANAGFIESRDLVMKLRAIEESPWASEGFDLSVVKLAARLKGYKVKPCRNAAGDRRGYRLEHFADTFARYLGADEEPIRAPHSSEAVRLSEPQVMEGGPSDVLTPQGVSPSEAACLLSWESDALTPSDDVCPQCGFSIVSNGHEINCGGRR